MSQEELAKKVGLAQATISRVLNCTTSMSVDQFEAICKALRLDPATVIADASR